MKRWIPILLLFCVLLVGCGTQQSNAIHRESTESTENMENTENTEENVLILYYSHSGTTEDIAQRIQEKIGGDIIEIETVREYASDSSEISDQAAEERESGNLPELKEIPDISQYERIYLGGPVWTYTVSTPVMSLLEQLDFQGKEVAPFWTDAGTPGDYQQNFETQVQNGVLLPGLGLSDMSGMGEEELNALLDGWLTSAETMTEIQEATDEEEPVESEVTTDIIMTAGNTVITATLDNSETTGEFLSTLPRTISMNEYGGREYYGRIEAISENGEGISDYENGDVTYYPSGPSFAIFYGDADNSSQSGLIRMGKVTSDLSVFENLDSETEFYIEIAE